MPSQARAARIRWCNNAAAGASAERSAAQMSSGEYSSAICCIRLRRRRTSRTGERTLSPSEKKAQANVITRREETASTRSLLNTAKLLEENPVLYKLKEMEYVEKIAEKVSNISVNGNGALIEQLREIFGASR